MEFQEPTCRPMLFWGNRKLLNRHDKHVRTACNHPLVRNKKLIARGVYSLIYDGTDSVLKLTIDRVAYSLAEPQKEWRNPYMPTTIDLFGDVGENEQGFPIRLIRLERLAALIPGSFTRKAAMQIGRLARKHQYRYDTPSEALQAMLPSIPDCGMIAALQQISTFAQHCNFGTALDMHASNFMQRDSHTHPVITDPFVDLDVLRAIQQLTLRRLGLPENTICM